MTTLVCPKCGAGMRGYERNRILVDQCTGCGGLFLDRGELESLVAAENAWHASAPSGAPGHSAPVSTPQDRRGDDRDEQRYAQRDQRDHDDRGYAAYQGHQGYDPRYRKKKKSFLSELFDD